MFLLITEAVVPGLYEVKNALDKQRYFVRKKAWKITRVMLKKQHLTDCENDSNPFKKKVNYCLDYKVEKYAAHFTSFCKVYALKVLQYLALIIESMQTIGNKETTSHFIHCYVQHRQVKSFYYYSIKMSIREMKESIVAVA